MAHLIKTSFHQNPNIGLYSFANDKFCLLPRIVSEPLQKEMGAIFHVQSHVMNICGTSLLGVFIAGNNHSLLLPKILFDAEQTTFDKLKIPYTILNTDSTALGNNIVSNDHACLIHPDLEPCKAEIKKALKVEKIKAMTIAGIPTVGSLIVLNDKGCLLTAFASDEEAAEISSFFNLPVTRGTVNMGSPFVRSGVTSNSHGFAFGSKTGGPEAVQIDEALGFLK